MKKAYLIIGCLFCLSALAQDDFKRDLDKAKDEMKKNGADEYPDYNRAGRLLESALSKNAIAQKPGTSTAMLLTG